MSATVFKGITAYTISVKLCNVSHLVCGTVIMFVLKVDTFGFWDSFYDLGLTAYFLVYAPSQRSNAVVYCHLSCSSQTYLSYRKRQRVNVGEKGVNSPERVAIEGQATAVGCPRKPRLSWSVTVWMEWTDRRTFSRGLPVMGGENESAICYTCSE